MKKIFSFLMVACLAMGVSAKQYCHETISSNDGSKTIQLSCEQVSEGNYRITVEGENLNGFGGSFFNPGATDLRTTVTSNTSTKIVCDIAAATAPSLYTPLYVMMPGEVVFTWPDDIEWGSCGSDAVSVSEYCNYYGPQTRQDGKYCAITWTTNAAGDVVINLADGPHDGTGYTNVSFRGDCFEGSFDLFKVVSSNGEENASVYFTRERSAAENYYILRKNETPLPEGTITIKTTATLAWSSAENASRWQNGGLEFNYTYGTTCPSLDAPANVAVANDGTITFDAVEGAESYLVFVYDGEREVYNGAVTSGAQIDYAVYVAKTLTVKVVAKTGGIVSAYSDPATWNASASDMAASIWCETPGVVTVANECSHAAFTINTLPNGNVTIEIRPTEGTEEGAKFRGSNGMNGTFKLNGSTADFATYFTASLSADKKIVTLSLVDTENAPEIGSVIDYSGQIEAASSLHGNDWSNYNILGYVYGSTCPDDIAATGVALNKTTATIYVGDSPLVLNAIFTPSNTANKNVTWTSSNTAVATVENGTVTAVAAGEATITVTTEDGNFTATCAVTVAGAIVAPAAPTWPASQVKAIYSATYDANCGFGEWGSGTQYSQTEAGKKYIGGTYFGLIDFALNCAAMEKFHMDVFPMQDMIIRVVPIWGGAEQGVHTVNLVANQWNAVDIEMSSWNTINNWTNIYQVKLDGFAAGSVFYVNNVYFYRETAPSDTEAPVMTSASLVSTSFTSAVIAVDATDNELVAQYLVKNGDVELGKYAAVAGNITVKNLAMGTAYNLSVYAVDAAENVSANKIDVALTTMAAPTVTTAPTAPAADVIALYSDAYTTVAYTIGGWGQSTHEENFDLAAGEHALYMTNCNYQGWEFATLDLSEMTHVHFDVYVGEASSIKFTPIWVGEAAHTFTLEAGWNAIDAELTTTWPGINLANVYQVKFDGMPAVCFIDNVYFYRPSVVEPDMTYELNGGALAPAAQPTNAELWEAFKPYYNSYYSLARADRPITEVSTFASAKMQEIMTDEASDYKWLGDYVASVCEAAGMPLTSESNWRWEVHAFFNCVNTALVEVADFTEAGQPAAWKAAWDAAHPAVAMPEVVTVEFTLPEPAKEGYTFAGWYWTENFTGDAVTTLEAGATGTLYAKWVAVPTSLDNVESINVVKYMKDGQLFIMKNGVIYNAMGQLVK